MLGMVCRPQLLQVLIGLFELPQDTTAVTDDIPMINADPDADSTGLFYVTLSAFSALFHCISFLCC